MPSPRIVAKEARLYRFRPRLISARCIHMACAMVLAGAALSAACVRALPGEPPPENARLYYPSRMALGPDGNTAFVVNANFDQRFNTSWITQVDLPRLLAEASREGGTPMAALSQGLRVPSLGGDLVLNAAMGRAYLPHRGSGLVTVMDIGRDAVGKTTLRCGDLAQRQTDALTQAEAHTDCDRDHLWPVRTWVAHRDGSIIAGQSRRYDDPYAAASLKNPAGAALFVGFLGSGRISTIQDLGDGAPQVLGYVSTPADGVARLVADASGLLLAASRAPMAQGPSGQSGLSYMMGVGLPASDVAAPFVGPVRRVAAQHYALSQDLGGSPANPQGAPEVSGMVVSPRNPNRLFVLSRAPDALALLQLSTPPATTRADNGTVVAQAEMLAMTLLGAETVAHSTLSDLAYVPRPGGDLLLVTSLTQDMIYVFDPTGDDLQLVHRIHLRAGMGPVALLHAQVNGRDVLLVSTFFDHGLTVIDISATNFADFHVIASLHDENFFVAPRIR